MCISIKKIIKERKLIVLLVLLNIIISHYASNIYNTSAYLSSLLYLGSNIHSKVYEHKYITVNQNSNICIV